EKPDAPPAAAPPSPPAPAPHRRNVRPHADCPATRLGILLSCRPDRESRNWRPEHKAHETAGTVAALSAFAAVGIENAIRKAAVGAMRRLHQQNPITTNAKMTIGKQARLRRGQVQWFRSGVDHHKIIAQAMPVSRRAACAHCAYHA